MFHPIFTRALARGVTPVMFGNELLVRGRRNTHRSTACAHGQRFPLLAATPSVLNGQIFAIVNDVMLHRHGGIAFAIKNAGHGSNGAPRNKLTDKNHATFPAVD